MRLTGQQIQDEARAYYKRRLDSPGPTGTLAGAEWRQVNAYWSWILTWLDYGIEIGKAREKAEKRRDVAP